MKPFASLLLSALVLFGCAAHASGTQSIADQVVSDWQSWMRQHKIKAGSLVVAYQGEILAQSGIKRSIDDPAKIASLSKAITAVCAMHALEQANKNYRATLAETIPSLLAKYPPVDTDFGTITIGQLIAQYSGIQSRYHRKFIQTVNTFKSEQKKQQFQKLVREKLATAPKTAKYHYSNANYLVLGLVIEALSGEDYEPYCQRTVLAPAGIQSARLSDDWAVMSAWGGWEISARDYLNFVEHYFGGNKLMGKSAHSFQPRAERCRGRMYGPGVLFRATSQGVNIWHAGSWRWKGRVHTRFGAYFAAYDNGFTVVTNYAHDAWDGQQRELDKISYKTTHP